MSQTEKKEYIYQEKKDFHIFHFHIKASFLLCQQYHREGPEEKADHGTKIPVFLVLVSFFSFFLWGGGGGVLFLLLLL